jgi:hypothetical protein
MKFEEVLPEIRKGRKARRKDYPAAYLVNSDKYRLLTVEDVFANDWELVPEPKKYSKTVCLWDNGSVTLGPFHPLGNPNFVETRVIEWEVE